jgi:hypothetical protein
MSEKVGIHANLETDHNTREKNKLTTISGMDVG